MIHIRLCNHGTHRLLNIPLLELEASVLIPYSFEVENRSSEVCLQKAEGAGVCYGCRGGGVMGVRWEDEVYGFYVRINVPGAWGQ
jgi:hypothetical protein